MTQLPEIREADAPPHIAAIYADIKQVAVLPQVNLIFRYFATYPGVLEWVWQTLRPLYGSRELIEAAKQLISSIDRPGPSPLLEAMNANQRKVAGAVLDAYNSGNPQNLIALTALVKLLDNRDGPGSPRTLVLTPREDTSINEASVFPALPRRDDLPAEARELVERLAARHRPAPATGSCGVGGNVPAVVPSLYLHLALWPAVLGAVDAYLQPIIESGCWRARVAAVLSRADASAERLLQGVELMQEPPDAETLTEVAGTIRAFIKGTIPELIVVGRLLKIE